MANFDVAKDWHILAPASVPAAWNAADELARYINLLREGAGLAREQPLIEDAGTVSPPASTPIILLNAAADGRDRNGFSWRLGRNRIEINGDSDRGLWNGLADFLAALGIRWPRPGQEELPAAPSAKTPSGAYPLSGDRAYSPSIASVKERRRLFISQNTPNAELELLIPWAAKNKYDALIFSFSEKSFWNKIRRGRGAAKTLEHYALILEAGGHDISLLLSRRLFFFQRDLFRMDSGRRVKDCHFCPTNPKTTRRVMNRAWELFSQAMLRMAAMPRMAVPGTSACSSPVFHLWPDAGHEKAWCACPACRAFSPAEQNRIAVNSAADALAACEPKAWLCYFEEPAENEAGADELPAAPRIVPRGNTFALSRYPERR
jgi:hypothetical protein